MSLKLELDPNGTPVDLRLACKTDLSSSQKILLAHIVSELTNTDEYTYTNKEISRRFSLATPTIGNALREFEERGWITIMYGSANRRIITMNSDDVVQYYIYLGTWNEYDDTVTPTRVLRTKNQIKK